MANWVGLAVDLGASNGRTIAGEFDGERLRLHELTRFPNRPVELLGTVYWDFPGLFRETLQGIEAACRKGLTPATVGIDSWGVDFGFIDAYGELMGNPRHYRNACYEGIAEEVVSMIGAKALYRLTGVQTMQINTLFQLVYIRKHRPELLERCKHALLFPDLINYFLTGEKASEFTHATTTQLFHPGKHDWAHDLLAALELPADLFPPVVSPLRRLGPVRPSLWNGMAAPAIEVVHVGEHDTASAFFALRQEAEDTVYFSCGTWALIGITSDTPVLTDSAERYGFSNEGGVGGGYHILRNMTGLWLLQEMKRMLERNSAATLEYGALASKAEKAAPFLAVIDPDDSDFLAPNNMIDAIQSYCRRTGQPAVSEPGELFRIVLESLALKSRYIVEKLEEIAGKPLAAIRMTGGGIRHETFCQWIADATNKPVVAGPEEAAAAGSLCAQLIASGELTGIHDVPGLVDRSFPQKTYYPGGQRAEWDAGYEKLLHLLEEC